ncbi:MAG: diaminopimelate epimerase [Acidobacteriota bacterium]
MKFIKAQASGNDFIVFHIKNENEKWNEIAQKICDRHYGIGSDGLVILKNIDDEKKEVNFRIFNADGSEAEISGNGLRCAAASLYFKNLIQGNLINFITEAGRRECYLINRESHLFYFKVNMGNPVLSSDKIPFNDGSIYEKIIDYPITIGQKTYSITCVSVGNPHCSIFFDKLPSSIEWHQLGKALESHPFFPNRVNVELVRIINREEMEALFWERGVGETLSSGSGSCASALAAMIKDLVNKKVKVKSKAGEMVVEWEENGAFLSGPSEIICEGTWVKPLQ